MLTLWSLIKKLNIMEKEIKGAIISCDLSIKVLELKFQALQKALEIVPGIDRIYTTELYRLLKEFESSLSADKLTEYESFGFFFPLPD
jgi:hypothetical protein